MRGGGGQGKGGEWGTVAKRRANQEREGQASLEVVQSQGVIDWTTFWRGEVSWWGLRSVRTAETRDIERQKQGERSPQRQADEIKGVGKTFAGGR